MAAPPNMSPARMAVVVVGLVLALVVAVLNRDKFAGPNLRVSSDGAGPGEYLFCFWNVENLFDDRDDRRGRADEEYDTWFVESPADRQLKYERLADALVRLNGGRGPDILAAVEVESVRAAELLRDELNRRLPDGAAKYGDVAMKEVAAGRHIAPAIISRLPVTKTKGFGTSRLVHVNLEAGGHELVLLASHWTSQLTDDTGDSRRKYADLCYGTANEVFTANPAADILLCGDFNATPEAPEVADGLRLADRAGVTTARELRLFDLLAGKDPQQFGTHYHGKPLIYDHVCVSPGLLDGAGWSCDVDSVQAVTNGLIRPEAKRRQPWRFGNRKDDANRGYSDHFPVTVKLKVAP